LNKDLTQTALQSGRMMFGSRFTQNEVGLMLTKANPSATTTQAAVHELLLQDNLRAGYATQKQGDYETFVSQGGDPRKFGAWYNRNFPLQKYAIANRDAADAALTQQENAGRGGAGQQTSGAPVSVTSPEQARALSPGTTFITPDGKRKVR
jgi:hypothetical protein